RRGQPRNQASARQRGLARPARPHDQEEWAAAIRCFYKPPSGLANHAVAAEEYSRMFGLEWRQSSERRPLFLRPRYARPEKPARLQPLPQQVVNLLLECIGAGEILKRGLEITFLRSEPLAPECL